MKNIYLSPGALKGLLLALTFLVVITFIHNHFLGLSGNRTASIFVDKIKNEKNRSVRFSITRDLVQLVGPEDSIKLLNKLRQKDLKYFQMSEIHLLMHVVGEEAYKKFGYEALSKCYEDIFNGCTHGVILSVIDEEGLDGVKNIINACKSQPPYSFRIQCVHGAGHGFLAYSNYEDLPGALTMCDSLPVYNKKDLDSCYYAVFMENVFGEHNGVREDSRAWLNKDKICDSVDSKYRNECYKIQPSWWYKNLRDFKKTAIKCYEVPLENRPACAAGFGMLAHTIKRTFDAKDTFADCSAFFKEEEFIDQCLLIVNKSGLSRHEFDFAVNLCKKISSEESKKECYQNIIYFLKGSPKEDEISTICPDLEPEYLSLCNK
jgi:hypothetical protein